MTALVAPTGAPALTQGAVLDALPWGLDPAPLGVVLTNPCDLRWEKASYVIVSALVSAKDVIWASSDFRSWAGDHPREGALSKKRWDSLSRVLQGFVRSDSICRYFLVESDVLGEEMGPLVADFQHLLSIPIEEAGRKPVVALLPPPDREKLIMHFAAYTSRIGVDRAVEREQALIKHLASPFRPPPPE